VFFTNFERWHDKLLRLTAADLSKAWALLVRALKSGDPREYLSLLERKRAVAAGRADPQLHG
jgi:hypothetical protein